MDSLIKHQDKLFGYNKAQAIPMKKLSILTALCVASLFLPLEISIGPAVARPFDFLLILSLSMYIFSFSKKGQLVIGTKKELLKEPIFPLLCLYFFYLSLSAFLFTGVSVWVKESIQYSEMIVLFLLCVHVFKSKQDSEVFVKVFTFSLFLITFYAVTWHIMHGHLVYYKNLNEPKLAFGVLSFVAVCYFLSQKKKKSFIYSVLMFGSVVLMLMSGEKKGWVAFFLSISIIYILNTYRPQIRNLAKIKKPKPKNVIFHGVAGVAVFLLLFIGWQVPKLQKQFNSLTTAFSAVLSQNVDNYMKIEDASTRNRLYLLSISLQSFKENPFLGLGTEQFKGISEKMAEGKSGIAGNGAHSIYQQVLVDNGLLGLGLLLALFITMARRAIWLSRNVEFARSVPVTFAIGMVFYGIFVNAFLGGGVLNFFFYIVPAGAIVGLLQSESYAKSKKQYFKQHRYPVKAPTLRAIQMTPGC